ncbi:MAG: histidine kinase, partial [Deltaproteobacteria bacterium]|nr:histidine kinase [Deltaproteobacteria bacterium]
DIVLTLDLNLAEQFCIDVEALRQIIVNTSLNAIQAMPEGGSLTLRTKLIYNRIVIVVKDSGTGIAPDVKNRIFDPFFTTKEVGEGTGLGLAVTYSLVQQMGGTIEVESEPGKGTVFTISLPANQKPVKHAGDHVSMPDKEC